MLDEAVTGASRVEERGLGLTKRHLFTYNRLKGP